MIRSADEFARLRNSADKSEYDRAAYDEAPEEVWRDIIGRHPEMREWVAHNKTVPLEILELLSSDASSRVGQVVAMKRKLSVPLFERLATDNDPTVRYAIARNPKTPREVLASMLEDESQLVAEEVARRLS